MAVVQSLRLADRVSRAALFRVLRAWVGAPDGTEACADTSLLDWAPPAELRVLLAGGGPTHQRLVVQQLILLGIDPVIARHGEDAARLAAAHAFDIILMDVEMSVMYGFAAATRIREHERTHPQRRRVPIVALQASGATAIPALLQQRGIDAVLRKSCRADELQACLQRWCRNSFDTRGAPVVNWRLGAADANPGEAPCTR